MRFLTTFLLVAFATIIALAQPINDDCVGAIPLTLPFYSTDCELTNVNATPSLLPVVIPADPPPLWQVFPPAVQRDVWFTFITPNQVTNIEVIISGCIPNFKPKIALYKGDCSLLISQQALGEPIASFISGTDSLSVQINLLDSTTQYYLRVDNGDSTNVGGDFNFSLIPDYCNHHDTIFTVTACHGDTIPLASALADAASYQWNVDSTFIGVDTISTPQIIIDSSQIYTCIAYDTLGCRQITTIDVQVPTPVQPAIHYLAPNAPIAVPQSLNYIWYYSPTQTNFSQNATVFATNTTSISPNQTGYYQAVYVDSFGCEYPTSIHYMVLSSTSEISTIQNLQISPNPTSNFINIQFENPQYQTIEITLVNSLGQQVISKKVESHQGIEIHKIDVSTIPKGNYFLQLKTENEVITRNVLILH